MDPKQSKEKQQFIFIGEHVSPMEIQIYDLPTFYDALQLSGKQPFIKEHSYQYLNLHPDQQIHFHYIDGLEKKSGNIAFKKGSLEITTEQPLNAFITYLLIQKGSKVSFLTFPPNDKIKLRKKDIAMVHAQKKNYK